MRATCEAALALVVLLAGCHRAVDLTKVRRLYTRWDRGFQNARTCLFGTVARSPDPVQQFELAELFGEQPPCPMWLLDTKEDLPDVGTSSVDEKSAEKALEQYENAINIWSELRPADLTDELAASILRLSDAVRVVRRCNQEHCEADKFLPAVAELMDARNHLGQQLGFPQDPPAITIPTRIELLTPGPEAPPVRGHGVGVGSDQLNFAGSKWSIRRSGDHLAVFSESGRHALDLKKEWGEPYVLADPVEPIIWQESPPDEDGEADDLVVYQPVNGIWHTFNLHNVLQVDSATQRLDVVFRASPDDDSHSPHVEHFSPGNHDFRITVLEGIDFAWSCSADHYLWVLSQNDTGAQMFRYSLANEELVRPIDVPPGATGRPILCDDQAVAFDFFQVRCTASECSSNEGPGTNEATLLDGKVVRAVHLDFVSAKRGQLFAVRVVDGRTRVFRVPPGVLFNRIYVRDHKLVAAFDQGREAQLPWPL